MSLDTRFHTRPLPALVPAVATTLCVGCGTSTEVEGQLTVTQGLHGQLTQR